VFRHTDTDTDTDTDTGRFIQRKREEEEEGEALAMNDVDAGREEQFLLQQHQRMHHEKEALVRGELLQALTNSYKHPRTAANTHEQLQTPTDTYESTYPACNATHAFEQSKIRQVSSAGSSVAGRRCIGTGRCHEFTDHSAHTTLILDP